MFSAATIWHISGVISIIALLALIAYAVRGVRGKKIWIIGLTAVTAYVCSIIGMMAAFQIMAGGDALFSIIGRQYRNSEFAMFVVQGYKNFHIHSIITTVMLLLFTWLPSKLAANAINRFIPGAPPAAIMSLALALSLIWSLLPLLDAWYKAFFGP